MTRPKLSLLHELVSAVCDRTPNEVAVVAPDGQATSFRELDSQVRSVATWVSRSSERGDRIAVVADNGLPYVQLYYGVPRCGRVLALVNQRLSAAEQLQAISSAEPRILVGDKSFLDALSDVRSQAPSIELVVEIGSSDWTEVVADTGQVDEPPALDDPAWLLFTSGSTGTPKGVVHTHRSLSAAVWGGVDGRAIEAGGSYLLPFPMCHIAGYNVLVHHAAGCTVVLATQFRADAFVAAVNEFGITSCSLAPTMLHAVLAHLDGSGASIPTLRSISYGSAAISADLIRRATDRLAVDFHQGYGMTETGGNVTFLNPDDHREGASGDPAILLTVGRPHRWAEPRIVNEAGAEVTQGDIGEIVIKGDQVMTGYWRDAQATDVALVDGWLRTGDVGRVDDAGRLTIVDRLKDIIITGGENVSSREVEDALSTHGGVEMVAVVGVPDAYWGEAICAVVVPRGPRPEAADLIAHVRAQITAFKRPRHVLFVDELPLTTNGKIAKHVLRRLAAAELEAT